MCYYIIVCCKEIAWPHILFKEVIWGVYIFARACRPSCKYIAPLLVYRYGKMMEKNGETACTVRKALGFSKISDRYDLIQTLRSVA